LDEVLKRLNFELLPEKEKALSSAYGTKLDINSKLIPVVNPISIQKICNPPTPLLADLPSHGQQ